jgi:hypothetical protein
MANLISRAKMAREILADTSNPDSLLDSLEALQVAV